MGKTKTVFVNCRMTEEEVAKLDLQMRLEGYRNRSYYIRDCLLGKRVFHRRNLRKTDANLIKEIEILRSEIKRIGINYNQVVRAVNTLAGLRDKRGNAVITQHTIDAHLTDLKSLTMSLIGKANEICLEVARTTEDNVQP